MSEDVRNNDKAFQSEGDAAFYSMLSQYDLDGLLPVLTEDQERCHGLITGALEAFSLDNPAQMSREVYKVEELRRCALWGWHSTDEQIIVAEWTMRLTRNIDWITADGVYMSHLSLMAAILAPGAQHSTFVTQAHAIVQANIEAMHSDGTTPTLARILPSSVMSTMTLVHGAVAHSLLGESGTVEDAREIARKHTETGYFQGQGLMNFLEPLSKDGVDSLKDSWSKWAVDHYIHCLYCSGKTFPDDPDNAYIAMVNFALPQGRDFLSPEEAKALRRGAMHLIELRNEKKPLPREISFHLDKVRAENLITFGEMMDESNLEWALAAIDWTAPYSRSHGKGMFSDANSQSELSDGDEDGEARSET